MDNLNKKARLIDDWSWILYEDGSGHIENSEDKQFCSFDYTTQEVKDLNNRWQFMNEYPCRTPWEMFNRYFYQKESQDQKSDFYEFHRLQA